MVLPTPSLPHLSNTCVKIAIIESIPSKLEPNIFSFLFNFLFCFCDNNPLPGNKANKKERYFDVKIRGWLAVFVSCVRDSGEPQPCFLGFISFHIILFSYFFIIYLYIYLDIYLDTRSMCCLSTCVL